MQCKTIFLYSLSVCQMLLTHVLIIRQKRTKHLSIFSLSFRKMFLCTVLISKNERIQSNLKQCNISKGKYSTDTLAINMQQINILTELKTLYLQCKFFKVNSQKNIIQCTFYSKLQCNLFRVIPVKCTTN